MQKTLIYDAFKKQDSKINFVSKSYFITEMRKYICVWVSNDKKMLLGIIVNSEYYTVHFRNKLA